MLSTETRREIERRALAITAIIDQKTGPYHAEIICGVEPQWHLIETLPNQENKAATYLIDRMFGIFLPKFTDDATLKDGGGNELCSGRRLIFPGHIFAFVWDIAAHWRRIKTCPGVSQILMDQPEHPVVVPDRIIDKIQALQYGLSPDRKGKRKSRKARRLAALHGDYGQDDGIEVKLTTMSYWSEMTELDDSGRNRLLHKALGLAT